ncbi:hypothetical protein GCM10010293_65940 [Streptomyces griseoflavus]|nr:hypothetical protein GCM10010293_65940 [Streptomyces griseoflavus]
MVDTLPHASAVPMTMPRISPTAQPVRQCRVALTAVVQDAPWCWVIPVIPLRFAGAQPVTSPPTYTPRGYIPGAAEKAVEGSAGPVAGSRFP